MLDFSREAVEGRYVQYFTFTFTAKNVDIDVTALGKYESQNIALKVFFPSMILCKVNRNKHYLQKGEC